MKTPMICHNITSSFFFKYVEDTCKTKFSVSPCFLRVLHLWLGRKFQARCLKFSVMKKTPGDETFLFTGSKLLSYFFLKFLKRKPNYVKNEELMKGSESRLSWK